MAATFSRLRPRPLTLAAAAVIGMVVLLGATVRASPGPSATSSTLTAAPSGGPPPPAPPIATPRAPADPKRMWAVSLSNMAVYENGSGYMFGFFRTLGSTTPEAPARLYWGRGCPEISDRVYTLLQTGYTRQDAFFLIVDREPDPRQQGAYCVRGVELESRTVAPLPPPPLAAPPPPPGAK